MQQKKFIFCGEKIFPGEKKVINIPIPNLYSSTPSTMPIYVKHGRQPGPVVLITAALHGDEINGVEIIRRLFKSSKINNIKGTLVAIPVTNSYGFVALSRYLPDRRDLNRSFPGSSSGSLAARLAYLFSSEMLPKVDLLIDLHTGSKHRVNLPQIRVSRDEHKIISLAKAFNAPVILISAIRPGTIRQQAELLNVQVLVYEGGEALRFDEIAIRYGLRGILGVMAELKMIRRSKRLVSSSEVVQTSTWMRAPFSGMIFLKKHLGQKISKDQIIGHIFDPFTTKDEHLIATCDGIIVGRNNLPLVNEGDAIINVASLAGIENIVTDVSDTFEDFGNYYQ